MASISFPTNPTNGDTYTYNGVTYEFNSAKSQWIIQVGTSLADVNINAINDNMVPSANVTYDLGTAENSWRDLYLSGNTINLGGQQITANENGIVLPEGSTVGGVTIGTGSGGATQYANTSALPTSGLTAGEFAFVGNTLFMTNGSGWYSVALINQTPELTLSTSSIALGGNGNTINFTFTATDPDGPAPTVTATTTANTFQANVTLYTANSTVTVENLSATDYNATITITASDGINQTFGTVILTVGYISQFWNDTVLSIGTSSTNGLNNSTFIDRSTNAHTVTPTGSPVQTAFHPYLDNWSVEFDGTGDTLKTPSSADFAFGTGDFTVEFWLNYRGGNGYKFFWNLNGGSDYIGYGLQNNTLTPWLWQDADVAVGNTNITPNTWQHHAVVRNNGVIKIYLDGIEIASGNYTTNIAADKVMCIGGNGVNDTQDTNGIYSNFRVIKGTALYTANFTPPTENLTAVTNTTLLTCQSNRFIDNSTNGHTITPAGNVKVSAFNPFGQGSEYTSGENKGSIFLDGTDDALDIAATSDFTFGTGDFTIQGWVYTDGSDYFTLIQNGQVNLGIASTDRYFFGVDTNGGLSAARHANGGSLTAPSGTVGINQWAHIALTRQSGTLRMYVNGVQVNSSTIWSTFSIGGPNPHSIGFRTTPNWAGGYISEVRIDNTCLYPDGTTFSVPTTPIGSTGALFYLPMDNAGIFDKTGNSTLTLFGNIATSTTQTKFADTAMYFDGSGDYIRADDALDVITSTSQSFTIECWLYQTSASATGSNLFVGMNKASDGSNVFVLGTAQTFFNGSDISFSNGFMPTNQWVHYAAVYDGSSLTIYFDGIVKQTRSGTLGAALSDCVLGIGAEFDAANGGTPGNYFTGYIENFQILNGVAKYTTNFTPPTRTQGRLYQAES